MVQRLDVWLKRLQDADPAQRRAAVRQLEIIGDVAALSALARVFARDPEADIRKLAQQAGKAIYYAAIKREQEVRQVSDRERQKAAEILAKAQARKQQRRR
jgi:hypothetical protein